MEAISTFFTDPLRLTLGAAAVVVLLGIFVFGRKGKNEPAEELSTEEINEFLTRNDDQNVIVKNEPVKKPESTDLADVREEATSEALDKPPVEDQPKPVPTAEKPEDMFVVLHVVAPEGMAFTGNAIRQAVDECNLVYGEFKIFHYPHPQNESLSLFSVVNMLKPGFFEAEKMADLTTTGISFFMRIPVMEGHHNDIFTTMLATAQAMSRKLGGGLLDEKHEALTQVQVDKIKQQIENFENKLKLTENHAI